MGIRLPLKTVLTVVDSATSSIATGTIKTFTLPQDTDNMVVKLRASITGGGVSAFAQTTDDGGNTWYDLGRTSVISNGVEWLTIPVAGSATAIGGATGSVVAGKTVTGLPVLSPTGRLVLSYATAGTANTVVVAEVKVNSESQNG